MEIMSQKFQVNITKQHFVCMITIVQSNAKQRKYEMSFKLKEIELAKELNHAADKAFNITDMKIRDVETINIYYKNTNK